MLYPFSAHLQKKFGCAVMANAHIHDYIEILYCLSGNADIYLNGVNYNFQQGDMIIIDSKEVHSVVSKSKDEFTKYIVVKFEPEVLYTTSKTVFEAKYVLPFTLSKSTHQKLFKNDEIKNTFIPNLLNEICSEFVEKRYGFELAIRTHICRIFLWILRGWNEKSVDLNIDYALNEQTIERLQQVFDYVASNYQNDITVSDVANFCNMSYSYFSRFFKKVMKKNFSEYLNFVRITAAEKLLTSSDFNITEIAQQVGFSTSSYFIQQFKYYKNISPKQFRIQFSA